MDKSGRKRTVVRKQMQTAAEKAPDMRTSAFTCPITVRCVVWSAMNCHVMVSVWVTVSRPASVGRCPAFCLSRCSGLDTENGGCRKNEGVLALWFNRLSRALVTRAAQIHGEMTMMMMMMMMMMMVVKIWLEHGVCV